MKQSIADPRRPPADTSAGSVRRGWRDARDLVLQAAFDLGMEVEVGRDVATQQLLQAEEVGLCSNLIGLWPVRALGERRWTGIPVAANCSWRWTIDVAILAFWSLTHARSLFDAVVADCRRNGRGGKTTPTIQPRCMCRAKQHCQFSRSASGDREA